VGGFCKRFICRRRDCPVAGAGDHDPPPHGRLLGVWCSETSSARWAISIFETADHGPLVSLWFGDGVRDNQPAFLRSQTYFVRGDESGDRYRILPSGLLRISDAEGPVLDARPIVNERQCEDNR